MCNKVKHRIECEACGYSYSEARYPEDYDNPLPCDCSNEVAQEHIKDIERLRSDHENHPYDCLCLICR